MPPPESPLRVGLIGCGHIAAAVHLPIMRHLSQVRLVAVAETDAERRQAAGLRAPGSVIVEDYRTLLQMPGLEAVLVCAPTALHAEVAEAAFGAGMHVYLEKPVAADLAGAERVREAWRRAGTVGMMGFNYRFNPLYQNVRSRLRSGSLGEVVAVRSVFATAGHRLPDWKRTRHTGGGALLDLASHHVDLLRFFLGQDVAEVTCQVHSRDTEDDNAVLGMRFADGLLAQTWVSLTAVEEDRFEIYGTLGKLTVDRHRSVAVEVTGARQADRNWRAQAGGRWRALMHSPYRLQKRLAVGYEPSYTQALERFVYACLARRAGLAGSITPDLPNVEDGCRSLAVIAAAQESARTGHAVFAADAYHEDPARQ